MVWGLSLETFTAVHVALSLVGIAAGLVVLMALLGGRERAGWMEFFLVTTVATSVTGFGFPVDRIFPSHVVGVVSLVVLAAAIFGRYGAHLSGRWRPIHVIAVVTALYLNVFVGVVQAFRRVPALNALAPQQTEPPFVVAQLLVLAAFVVVTIVAVRRSGRNVPVRA